MAIGSAAPAGIPVAEPDEKEEVIADCVADEEKKFVIGGLNCGGRFRYVGSCVLNYCIVFAYWWRFIRMNRCSGSGRCGENGKGGELLYCMVGCCSGRQSVEMGPC